MTIRNPILATDSYKFSHFMQYPAGATDVSSYIQARGTKIEGVTETVFAGLQIYIHEVLNRRITLSDVRNAAEFCAKHGTPFNKEGWEIIANEHGGYLPITIEAVPEGSVIPLHNVLVQVHCNDERLPWLTSYTETVILSYIWYASTVATLSREIKKVIKAGLVKSSDNVDSVLDFKLHDFGFRGVAPGAADVGGFAHLINFKGTDTVAGIECAMEHYGADVCGYSISASEHSTMTSWGRENEYEAYANMVKAYAKQGAIFACVIDSYDTFEAIRLWALPQKGNKSLLEQVKEAGATVVLRPDSGDPVKMPVQVVEQLMIHLKDEVTYNSKGYTVLPSHVRVIQGDGIDIDDVRKILFMMIQDYKFSTENIGFGMGGGLLQKVNRDTFKFAMKANAIEMNGAWVDVIKDPAADQTKKSHAGRQALVRHRESGEFKTIRKEEADAARKEGFFPVMRTVYRGAFGTVAQHDYTMEEVRKNAELV